MKKNKGFTLIEILAVITILAFVVMITVPSFESIIKKASEKTNKEQENVIFEATKNYMLEYNITLENNEKFIKFDDLKKSEFLDDKDYYNAKTDEKYSDAYIYVYKNEDDITKYQMINNFKYINESSTDTCFIHNGDTLNGIDYAKEGCTDLKDVVFPTAIDGVPIKKINRPNNADDNNYFNNYTESVSFSSIIYLTTIGDYAFEREAYKSIVLEEVDFANNFNLKDIGIEGLHIRSCTINNIIFPESLETIGDESIMYHNLKEVNIPKNVKSIGERAFYESGIEFVNIYGKKNVSAFENYELDAFDRNSKNLKITYIP